MPDREIHVVYRLLAEAPIIVSFPSVVYRIAWSTDRHVHSLNLVDMGTGGSRQIVQYSDPVGEYRGHGSARDIYTTGVDVKRPSILDTVFTRLVSEQRAEVLIGAHCRVTFRGPNGEFV